MASLSTCHLELVVWDGNLVKSCCVVSTNSVRIQVLLMAARKLTCSLNGDRHVIINRRNCVIVYYLCFNSKCVNV